MRLVFTGGGSGGHIIPNLTTIKALKRVLKKADVLYIGRKMGLEMELVQSMKISYKGIYCGKIRRYFSLKNVVDLLKVPLGITQSLVILFRFRPHLIFCKGGYVSFPVAVAGWLLRIPVIIHESDVHPGLANRIAANFAKVICISFEETKKYFPKKKVMLTGTPISEDLFNGEANKALRFTGFQATLPVILFMSGSQGDDTMNKAVWALLPRILPLFQIIHLCGQGKVRCMTKKDNVLKNYLHRYRAYEFLDKEMKDIYALSDLIVTRSGANTLVELAALKKPAILIPLGKNCSRGEQFENASAFIKEYEAEILNEDMNFPVFLTRLEALIKKRFTLMNSKRVVKTKENDIEQPLNKILNLINSYHPEQN